MEFVFDEPKAAQAAAWLLRRHGGPMWDVKLAKFLYPIRRLIDQMAAGELHEREPLSESLLRRMQLGALSAQNIKPQVQSAIRATLDADA